MARKESQAVTYLKSQGYDASLMPVWPPKNGEEKLGVYISSWDNNHTDKSEFRLHAEEVEALARMYKAKRKNGKPRANHNQ